MSTLGKLGWIVSLILAIGLGAMGYTFLVKGQTVPYADGRTSILLSPDERNQVLGEMRAILSGTRDIMEDSINGDFQAAEDQARAMGMAAANADAQILAKLPLDFSSLGLGLHRSFDDLADFIAANPDPLGIVDEVASLMVQCVACHDAYRLGIEGEATTTQ
ncbi:MAG TPA: hypothetical protein ENJ52_03890 [Aliiroseovarius sp.]|nr:hypothetical protein [Aliiroseovarius sp.]